MARCRNGHLRSKLYAPQRTPLSSKCELAATSWFPTADCQNRVEQNAKDSPLLRLPAEIRQLIWRAAIGDRLIHIKHFSHNQLKALERYRTHRGGTPLGGAFRHIQCKALLTEGEAYEKSKAPSQSVPLGEDPACYVQSCAKRHSSCYPVRLGTPKQQAWVRLFEQVDHTIADRDRITMCSLLGASRQIFEEGNRLFWLTNTFSFDEPESFAEFFGSLTLSQKRHLTNLHFIHPWYTNPSRNWEWKKVYKRRFRSLRGIKTLHLCIEQRYDPEDSRWPSQYRGIARRDEALIEKMLDPWLLLRTSPLANVTVVISDNLALLRRRNLLGERCTVAEKNWVAERIRERLTNAAAEAAEDRRKMQEAKALKKESERRCKAQTNAQQVPLDLDDSDDESQLSAVIDSPLHQMTTRAPAWRNLDGYQQNHMTRRGLEDSFDGWIAGPSELQQEQQPNHATHYDLSRYNMAAHNHEFGWIARPSEQQQEQQHQHTFPPQLYVDANEASYHVPVQARQRYIARQPAYDIYHPHSLHNNHMRQRNPPSFPYPGAHQSPDILMPAFAVHMNVDQPSAQEYRALSRRHQGARRHTVEEPVNGLFHPYPRRARQQQQQQQAMRRIIDGDYDAEIQGRQC